MAVEPAPAATLQSSDYRAILAALEMIHKARSIGEFRRLTLKAMDVYLDFPMSRLVIGSASEESAGMTIRLETGLAQDAYLSVFNPRSDAVGQRDHDLLETLRPHLASLLRSILLDGSADSRLEALSSRELELARLVALGYSNREIARHLGIREDTVKKHLWKAMRKLNVANRTQLAMALRRSRDDSTFVQ